MFPAPFALWRQVFRLFTKDSQILSKQSDGRRQFEYGICYRGINSTERKKSILENLNVHEAVIKQKANVPPRKPLLYW